MPAVGLRSSRGPERRCGEGEADPERRPPTQLGVDEHLCPEQRRVPLDDGQAEPNAAEASGLVELPEGLEDRGEIRGRNAGAGVLDHELDDVLSGNDAGTDTDVARASELEGVVHEV